MNASIAVVTVTTRNQFHRVRAVMQGIAAHLPAARRLVCCVDPRGDEAGAGDFEVVPADALGVPRFRQLAFALPATGVCCLLKSHFVLHALAQPGVEIVLYVDNDLALYRAPEELLSLAAANDLVLTPHLLAPTPAGALPNEAVIRRYGTFNAGLFAARSTGAAREFLGWWARHLLDPAHSQAATGWDQCWLDFAPSFVLRCAILRLAGYNVASWNLAQRPLRRGPAGWLAGGEPLTAVHFSAFNETQPERLFAPGLTCNYAPTPEVIELSRAYARTLAAHNGDNSAALAYRYGSFLDGTPIRPEQRALFATQLWPRLSPTDDPFEPTLEIDEFRGARSLYRYRGERSDFTARVGRRLRDLFRS